MVETGGKSISFFNNWFISAIKSSIVDGKLQEKNLVQNCINCNNQVKSSIDSEGDKPFLKYEEFRLNSTVIVLLGSSINSIPEISSSKDLIPLIKAIPSIEYDQLFAIIKGLKNYKYLRGALPWIPAKNLSDLLTQFINYSKLLTPLGLAISFEILFALIYSLQHEELVIEGIEDSLQKLVTLYDPKEIALDSKQNSKLRAYHFVYIIEALYLLVCILIRKPIAEPYTYSLGLYFKEIGGNLGKKGSPQLDSVIKNTISSLLAICNDLIESITSNVWISWHSIKSPSFGLSFSSDSESINGNSGKSVQLQVAHTVYNLLKITKNTDVTTETHELLDLTSNEELYNFFNHCAIDPNYDFDADLNDLELIESIENEEGTKKKKLVAILLGRENIFISEDCLKCVKENGGLLPLSDVTSLTNRLIDKLLQGDELLDEWKRVVLDLCRKLNTQDIINILRVKLNNGKLECLKTGEFLSDLTQIFNQLSDLSNECCNSFVWLCLQSGVEVVKNAIEVALFLPGLTPVVSPALQDIYFTCREKETHSEPSLIMKLLCQKLNSSSGPEFESQFIELVTKLLEKPDLKIDEQARSCDLLPIDISETLEFIIYPRLKWEEKTQSEILFAMEILVSIMQLYPDIVLESQAKLSALLVCLSLIHHNCHRLKVEDLSLVLNVRQVAENILSIIVDHILKDEEKYCKEISMVKVLLPKYKMSPRTSRLLSPLLHPEEEESLTVVDQTLALIINRTHFKFEFSAIPTCSRIEWIWAMYMLLPDCSEEEWLSSIHLTHLYINTRVGDTHLVTPTLKIYQEILFLMCDSVSISSDQSSNGNQISLRHCFKSFSTKAMSFINEKLKEDSKEFYTLINIFTWWCNCLKGFNCDPELPCLFLSNLCTALNDLIKSEAVVIIQSEAKRNGNGTKASSMQEPENDKLGNSLDSSVAKDDEAARVVTCDDLAETKRSSMREKITSKKFNHVMESLVRVFISSVTPNKMSSTVAGKLKTLCEL